MRIDKIVPEKRRKEAAIVHFGDGSEMSLHMETIARNGIRSGGEISETLLLKVLREDEVIRCRASAWRLLSVRMRSKSELEKGLRQRKFSKSSTEQITEELADKGFLNDAVFAKTFAQELAVRKQGPRLIEQSLRAKGIERNAAKSAAREALSESPLEEVATELLRKWNRRSKPEDAGKRKQAAAAFLIRRGYESEMVWGLVRKVLGAVEENE